MRRPVYSAVKRAFDITFATAGLALVAAPLAGCAVMIRMTSGAPVLFRQVRVGQGGVPFVCYKLRTMKTGAPQCAAARLSRPETYLTPLGVYLRRSSIDEVTQLVNILRGEMSFIGPRPLIPEEREMHRLRRLNGALSVRPGLSGLAQIRGRDTLPDDRKAVFDALYAGHLSPALDCLIFARTLRCLIH